MRLWVLIMGRDYDKMNDSYFGAFNDMALGERGYS
jgi:hypothetical protein